MESKYKNNYQIYLILSLLLFIISIAVTIFLSATFIVFVVVIAMCFSSIATRLFYDSYIALAQQHIHQLNKLDKYNSKAKEMPQC